MMIMRKPLQTKENGVNWEQQKAAPGGVVTPESEGLTPTREGLIMQPSATRDLVPLATGIEVTATGMVMPEYLPFDDWQATGHALSRAAEGVMWWLGDWWRYGQHAYGDRIKSVPLTGFAAQTCMDAGWVAGSIETSLRREVLSWSHHKVVAGLEPEYAGRMLDAAEAEGWSVSQLRAAVKALKRRSKTEAILAGPAVEDDSVTHADCLTFIDSLADGSVDLLLTDPPYAVTENDWDTWGTETDYWDFMAEWLTALLPKMAPEHTAFVFCDADASPMLHSVMTSVGWPLLRQVIWHRPNLAKKRDGSLTFLSAYEPFWHAGTRALVLPEEWGEERFDVQRFVVPQSNHAADPAYHPTQKPLDLMRRLVTLGSHAGELVVDPFVGAGTTAVAAKAEGRRYRVGDQSEEYVHITRARLA